VNFRHALNHHAKAKYYDVGIFRIFIRASLLLRHHCHGGFLLILLSRFVKASERIAGAAEEIARKMHDDSKP
jgi:hypothetical protein